MERTFTLADIEQCTRLPLERLRYVVDSRILPGHRNGRIVLRTSHGRGIARTFMGFEAFGIVVAVLMLDGGMRRQMAMDCLDLLCDYGVPGSRDVESVPLYQAYSRREIIGLEIGDGVNVRLVGSGQDPKIMGPYPWVQVKTRGEVHGYEPLVAIQINVVKLRHCFSG